MYKRSGQISPLGDALQGMLREHEIQEPLRPHIARAIWAEVVGPEIAAATIAETVRGGVVFVRVKSNVWANELTFLKQDILDRLNRRLGAKILTDIHFKTTGRALTTRSSGKFNQPDRSWILPNAERQFRTQTPTAVCEPSSPRWRKRKRGSASMVGLLARPAAPSITDNLEPTSTTDSVRFASPCAK